MSYAELRAKSNFSFLTGASHPEELVQQAITQGLKGIAVTDMDGVYGMPRGYKIAKDSPGIKYLVGAEFVCVDHDNITVLAQTRAAYGKICQLLTQAKQGCEKGKTHLEFSKFTEALGGANSKELFILPRISKTSRVAELKEAFNDKLYLPLTVYLDGNDKKRVAEILELSQKYSAPYVATNDVEYHVKERKVLQDVLVSIREGKSLQEVGFKLQPNAERYIKSPEQMQALYKDFPGALERTLEIADACSFCPSELRYRYPSEWIPEGYDAQGYLEHLVWNCVPDRYPNGMSEKVRAQLMHELQLIKELKFADYFLTIYDIVEFAKKRDILCQGRGSAANSTVCFVIGITAIDPIQMDLLFERFISVERGEPPDIDIDFEHERREEVLQYIYEKYGRHRAAMVSAVVTYRRRSAFREVCKAFGVPVGTLSAKKVERDFDEISKDLPEPEKLREQIDRVADEIHGFPRHLSIHSGGFTLSADPITDIVPVEPARMDGRTIIQWDKYDLDTLGLIKVDVLSLGMLSCLQKALKLTGKKLYEIPQDDKATYEMIQNRDTVGVFQIESRAQMSMLGRLKPANFYDLVIEVAIVRPGPIVGNMIHPYLKRRRGLEQITYPNEVVKRVLGKTLGVPLFQEQIMRLAIELADFTPGEADVLRKSINAWRSSAPIGVMAERLKRGLLNNGMTEEFAKQIFEQIQGFSHYGFPESHSASFALLAYASSYLKRHHPAEFACSLVNSQPMGFYRNDTILYDAMRNGVRVLPVSVVHSEWDCVMAGPSTIRLGFRLVSGLSKKEVNLLMEERKLARFRGLGDFVRRSKIKKDVMHRIALAGRFEEFHWETREALWALLEYQNLFKKEEESQLSFFNDMEYIPTPVTQSSFADMDSFEKIQNDYGAFSVSTHGHPMQELRRSVNLPKATSRTLLGSKSKSRIRVAGLVLIRQKPPTAKGVCFATLEDEFGFMDIILWKKNFDKYKEVFLNHCFIIVSGEVQKDENTVSLLVDKVEPVWQTANLDQTPLPLEPHQYFY
ncbi:error-prone DNA polymerase [Bdellovibrio sp. HCB337]|uniref:error-prone DNA polymerase n=1 Tax=Bdellovibrio sp. HCB337 TaxID=3394358 RepID=UPI0039A43E80